RRIDPRAWSLLWSDLGGAHYANYELPLERRPPEIVPAYLPKISHWSIDAEAWLARGTDNTIVPVFGGWLVLAEHAEFRFFGGWKRCAMTRTSLPEVDWKSGPTATLGGMPRILNLSHLTTVVADQAEAILCTLDDGPYGDLRDATLTIHPRLLEEFDWKRSRKRPFEIVTAAGVPVVKTLRWMDGVG